MLNWFGLKKNTLPMETKHIQEENFLDPSEVLTYFTALTGIHFRNKEEIATSKIIYYCRNKGIYSFLELKERLKNDFSLREGLINLLTVNETFFFREMGQIEFLKDKVIQDHTNIRILCAPGSSGEEAYSIAITLLEGGVSLSMIEIVSIDINSEATRLAMLGEYSPRSLYATNDRIKNCYFTLNKENKYVVNEELKNVVRFVTCNIFDNSLFDLGYFNVIFSRNMFIYFDEKTVIHAIERLVNLSYDNTLFFFGHADLLKSPPCLQEHYHNGVKYYTKTKILH